jgi:hypothetical protein
MKDEMKPKKGPEKYEIENAARTLMEAEEIKQNKELMPHVHKHIAKKQKALNSLSKLRAHKAEMLKGDMGKSHAEMVADSDKEEKEEGDME